MTGPETARLIVLAILLSSQLSWAEESKEVQPGRNPPPAVVAKIQPLIRRLRRTLAGKEVDATTAVCRELIKALGPWAGNPEAAPRYWPIERTRPDLDAVWKLWHEIDRRTRPSAAWIAIPDGDPGKMRTGLRSAGRPIIAHVTLARLKPRQRDQHLEFIRSGVDYLLNLQRDDGLFPFPDVRGRHPRFGPMLDKLLRRHPAALVEGWIVDDGGGGDLKYDNAICGVALIEAYEITKDEKYADAARAACDWAASRPVCTNWNYNAFSVWLLARFARSTGEQKYLDEAVERLRVGVLPGQMKNGRWLDPHNARLVYHGILVRGILEVYRALPAVDLFRETVRNSLVAALDNASEQIRTNGASSNSTTTEVLSRALLVLGPNPKWEEALKINVNAGIGVIQDRKAPHVGLYLADYLEYRLRMDAKGG